MTLSSINTVGEFNKKLYRCTSLAEVDAFELEVAAILQRQSASWPDMHEALIGLIASQRDLINIKTTPKDKRYDAGWQCPYCKALDSRKCGCPQVKADRSTIARFDAKMISGKQIDEAISAGVEFATNNHGDYYISRYTVQNAIEDGSCPAWLKSIYTYNDATFFLFGV